MASILTFSLAFYLAFFSENLCGIYSDTLSSISSGTLSGILSPSLFWHSLWHLFWHSVLPFILAYTLTSYLTLFLVYVTGLSSDILCILSGIILIYLKRFFVVERLARNTPIRSLRWRPGGDHSDPGVAVRVRWGTLRSGACSWRRRRASWHKI